MINIQKLLDEIQQKLPIYYPEIEDESWNLEVISHRKKHNKTFLRLRVKSKFDEQHNLFLKIYMNSSPKARLTVAREFYLHRIVFERLRHKTNSFMIPRPLDFFPKHNSILMEYVSGRRLDNLLAMICLPLLRSKTKERLHSILRTLTKFLILFNEAFPYNRTIYLKDVIKETETLISETCNLINNIELLKKLTNLLKIFSSELPSVLELSISHGDFRPSNILVDNERLAIIDWEDLNFRLKHTDLCNFVLHLILMSLLPPYSLKFQILISRTIISEYLKSLGSKETRIIRFIMLYTLLRMLNFYSRLAKGLWVHREPFDRIIGVLAKRQTIHILLNFPSFIDFIMA